ncbi:DUF4246 domain-containing protein [Phanerochaete sordida]|uniref:DUF4246 domain-containing protein n=1 Tax=Phanerochaete sordida TaxID=48140 RepID=A0A9P3LAH5_9APHY|nr:DUF4246 domain-containing protein [Phanerochaete sordida]
MSVYTAELAAGLTVSGVFRHPFRVREEDAGAESKPYDDPPLTANERNMYALSATIRAKPSWWTKAQDPEIRARWRSEAIGAPVPHGNIPLTEDEVDYVLDELAWYAAQRDAATGIEASIFPRIWQSDTLIDDELRSALLEAVAKLEDVPEAARDWHPRADGQVLDLVHPSLYPIVYDRTVLRAGYDPKPLPADPPIYDECQDEEGTFTSTRFSWLPTDFSVSEDGASVKALGYINNLDYVNHASAYTVVEQLIARFLPLWERVLTESLVELEPRRLVHGAYTWLDQPNPLFIEHPDLDENDEDRRDMVFRLPEVIKPFQPYPKPEEPVNLEARTLQIIVKLANIILTPDKPRYKGGSWHVEGMVNEAIVSSGIYYYDEDNITESALAFRMGVGAPEDYEQDDEAGVRLAYGLSREGPLHQEIGSVATRQGRCIAFPNVFQHQVQPFELADKSRPGHRKIVALFLVDPQLPKPRPSTCDVPRQQKEWMRAFLRSIGSELRTKHGAQARGFALVPPELVDMIVDRADWLMSRQEAEEYRLQLMDERSSMTSDNDTLMFSASFSMCEH